MPPEEGRLHEVVEWHATPKRGVPQSNVRTTHEWARHVKRVLYRIPIFGHLSHARRAVHIFVQVAVDVEVVRLYVLVQ